MTNNSLSDKNIAFFGTPTMAVYVLEELQEAGIVPDIIVTAPDKPAGRGLTLTAPPVKEWAEENDILTLQPHTLKQDFSRDHVDVRHPGAGQIEETEKAQALLLNSEWDVFIVAAYGKILPKWVLDLPRHGVLNVHPSLLPRFRGASPVVSQILADEKNVGVSIMQLDEEMDHGPILAQASVVPDPWPLSALTLEEILAREGGKLLAEALPEWISGELNADEQDHDKATYVEKIVKEDGRINLSDDGYQNYLKFCAYDGWPGVFFMLEKNGKEIRVKVTDATYEDGKFIPLRVIPEGKKEMDYSVFTA